MMKTRIIPSKKKEKKVVPKIVEETNEKVPFFKGGT
jgi:hypothetical protein